MGAAGLWLPASRVMTVTTLVSGWLVRRPLWLEVGLVLSPPHASTKGFRAPQLLPLPGRSVHHGPLPLELCSWRFSSFLLRSAQWGHTGVRRSWGHGTWSGRDSSPCELRGGSRALSTFSDSRVLKEANQNFTCDILNLNVQFQQNETTQSGPEQTRCRPGRWGPRLRAGPGTTVAAVL